jgi:hypothetical protein
VVLIVLTEDGLTVVFACLFWVGEGLAATAVHAFGSHVGGRYFFQLVCDLNVGLFGRNGGTKLPVHRKMKRYVSRKAVWVGRKRIGHVLGVSPFQEHPSID